MTLKEKEPVEKNRLKVVVVVVGDKKEKIGLFVSFLLPYESAKNIFTLPKTNLTGAHTQHDEQDPHHRMIMICGVSRYMRKP